MRPIASGLIALVVGAAAGCGGGDSGGLPPVTPVQHPQLEQDYAQVFAGLWYGEASVTEGGQVVSSAWGTQEIVRTGYNTLAVTGMCVTADVTAGVDGPTRFTIDPVICPGFDANCGRVSVGFYGGAGSLDAGTLLLTADSKAAGCGQRHDTVITFVGTLTGQADPVLASLDPAAAAAGGPGFTLSAYGSGFLPRSVVYWNGTGRSTTYRSEAWLTAEIGATDLAIAGSAEVTVSNALAGGGESLPLPFEVTASASLARASPAPAPHGSVTGLAARAAAGDPRRP